MLSDRFSRRAVSFFLLTVALWIPLAAAPQQPARPASLEPPIFADFIQRVQQYVKLQKGLPRPRNTKSRQETEERRKALAHRIRETREHAKQGEIFTPAIAEQFRLVIRSAFQGPAATNVRSTINQGEPVPNWKPTVNGDYPEDLPLTTVPPTLLLRLPQLPPEVAYRVVGHDFLLQDMEARVVIDFIPGAVP